MNLKKGVEDMFDDFTEPVPYTEPESWQPPTDIYETVDSFIVKMELPGIQPKEDIELLLESGNRLIVKGKRIDRTQTHNEHYHQDEINYGPFYRLIQLPDLIDEGDELKAKYKDGFIEVVLPKKQVEHRNLVIKSESKKNDIEEE